jgi:hypothetical protein
VTDLAIHAFGTLLKMGDGEDPEVFTNVAELRSIPVPQIESPRIDTSTHDNPAFFRSYVNNLNDLPAVGFDINYLPNHPTHNHVTGLLQRQLTGERTNFQVHYNSAVVPPVVVHFSATVSSFRPTAPVDNVYQAAVQLQPTSAPTYGSS